MTNKLTLRSTVRSLSLCIYDEQMPDGWEKVKELIRAVDKTSKQIMAIRHDRDYTANDWMQPSMEKPHYHIIIRILNNKNIHIEQLLRMFNIVFRKPEDDMIWQYGVQTTRDFATMATYLTHDTDQAISDGKAHYRVDEIVSNLKKEEIELIRDGYVRVSAIRKASDKDMQIVDRKAFELGMELGDYLKWYNSLDFMIRSDYRMRTVKESYYRGVEQRVNTNGKVNRLCVFIQGPANLGKTYAAQAALLNKKVLPVGGGETGKLDKLEPSHDAIIVDDDAVPNLLNMSDNYMCQAYRRQSNNPYWCGEYLIVTSNLSFKEWVKKCGISVETYNYTIPQETEVYKAVKSRFYICYIDDGEKRKIICTEPSRRGGKEEQEERLRKYCAFKDKYNQSLAEYKANKEEVDYSELNN